MTDLEHVQTSIIQVKVGNRLYPAVRSPRCAVCMHPARFQIEERILLQVTNAEISRWVSNQSFPKPDGTTESWPELSPTQIRNHRHKGHCPQEAMSQLVEERATELGFDLNKEMGQFVDHVVVKKAIMSQGYAALARGEIKPDVKDTLAAAKLLGDLEASKNDNATVEQWQEFMAIYFNAVRESVDEATWTSIIRKIETHPVVRVMNRQAIEAEVVEG